MRQLITILIFILFLSSPMIYGQICNPYQAESIEFAVSPRFVDVEAGWYQSWLDYNDGVKKYPNKMKTLQKWNHPWMKYDLPSAMHEDPASSDVSNLQGPVLNNIRIQYFQVREKGKQFSGMCPSFAYVDENTLVTLSFGRSSTTLLLVDITDTLKLIDAVPIPGRGHTVMELAKKSAREKLFKSTEGGAYFFLSSLNEVIIPGPNYNIFYIPIKDRKFVRDKIVSLDILSQIKQGDLLHEGLSEKEGWNKLTALMPDRDGNVWFTSRLGIVGMIDLVDTVGTDCPKVYSTSILTIGMLAKLKYYFGENYEHLEDVEFYKEGMTASEFRNATREYFYVEAENREEIQNSFSIGKDGVYINSNLALYKLRFNRDKKTIELDPKWEDSFRNGNLIYDNDWRVKLGQLNNGSGTTPTLVDDRFVAICDNDFHQINLCVYSQEDGSLVSKHKLFKSDSSACENSVVALQNSLMVGNTFNYVDPFKENQTVGGLMRFDFNEASGKYELLKNWPAEPLDCKSSTPKMTTANGLIYVYNRADSANNGHHDWQLTAIDFQTGRRVFYIRPQLDKGAFDDNIGLMLKAFSLGTKNYDRKVFNNIWATYAFGPRNSIYMGAYRGFLKISSDLIATQ